MANGQHVEVDLDKLCGEMSAVQLVSRLDAIAQSQCRLLEAQNRIQEAILEVRASQSLTEAKLCGDDSPRRDLASDDDSYGPPCGGSPRPAVSGRKGGSADDLDKLSRSAASGRRGSSSNDLDKLSRLAAPMQPMPSASRYMSHGPSVGPLASMQSIGPLLSANTYGRLPTGSSVQGEDSFARRHSLMRIFSSEKTPANLDAASPQLSAASHLSEVSVTSSGNRAKQTGSGGAYFQERHRRMSDVRATVDAMQSTHPELFAGGTPGARCGSGGPVDAKSSLTVPSTTVGTRQSYDNSPIQGNGSIGPWGNLSTLRSNARSREVGKNSSIGSDMQHFVAPSLPLAWPGVLQCRHTQSLDLDPHGNGTIRRATTTMNRLNRSAMMESSTSRTTSTWDSQDEEVSGLVSCGNWIERHVILTPNSVLRTVFDMTSLIVLFWDLTLIPYMLAWDVDPGRVMLILNTISASFWTADIFMSFVTGYHQKAGHLMKRPAAIAKHYMKRWFFPDVCIVVCDWASIILILALTENAQVGSLRILRFAKMSRLLRILGMMRLIKFIRVIEEWADSRLPRSARMSLQFTWLFLGIAWLNHLMCCMWFVIGRAAPSDTGESWVHKNDFLYKPFIFQYVTAFHWSMSQITLGSIEINCQNSWERLFNVLCLLFGLLFGSTLVSTLSAAMVDYQMQRKDKIQKLRALRQFLSENCVSQTTAKIVLSQVRDRISREERITEKDVKVLELLSVSVRADLRTEVFQPHICSHPLVRLWSHLDWSTFRRICVSSVDFVFLRASDELFVPGDALDEAYFLITGKLAYHQCPETSPVTEEETTAVDEGSWLCEAALWADWIHVGTATCGPPCQFCVLRSDAVAEVLAKRCHVVRQITLQYAQMFHKRLVSAMPPNADWPSDIHVPFTDFGDMVAAMNQASQTCIGLLALEQEASRSWPMQAPASLQRLHDEVESGKSLVTMTGNGDVERIVSVLALHISDADDKVLVQLGKQDKSQRGQQIEATFQLPGAKLERGELVCEAESRVMASKLKPLAECVEFKRTERSTEWKNSKEHGVRTKYLRTVCYASLNDMALPPMQSVRVDFMNNSLLHGGGSPKRGSVMPPLPKSVRWRQHESSFCEEDSPESVEIMTIREESKVGFYCWLSQDVFEYWRDLDDLDIVRVWLNGIEHEIAWRETAELLSRHNSLAFDDIAEEESACSPTATYVGRSHISSFNHDSQMDVEQAPTYLGSEGDEVLTTGLTRTV